MKGATNMKGKEKCRILKEIRQKIATENDIPYVTSECKHQGDCKGTCPKCEAELQYLENELAKRRSLGKRIAVAGLVATFTFAGTACDFGQTFNSKPTPVQTPVEDHKELDGETELPPPGKTPEEDEDDVFPLGGAPAPSDYGD
jgi:hypothetical protein